MAFLLAFLLPVSVFAAATPSNATPSDAELDYITATSSNASKLDALMDFSSVPMLLSDSSSDLPSVKNTVDYSGVTVGVVYYDMSGNVKTSSVAVGSDGYFNITRPSDYVSPVHVWVRLSRASLPATGNYSVECLGLVDAGGSNYYVWPTLQFNRAEKNQNDFGSEVGFSLQQDGFGQFYMSGTVELPSVTSLYFILVPESTFYFQWQGYVKVNFSKLKPGITPDVTDPYASPGDGDAQLQQDTSQIADNTSQMADTLKEIVQTISLQLEALWNQMYNYIHLEDMANADANAQKIVDKLDEGLNVEVENNNDNTQQIIDNATDNAQDIMANDDKNTNTVVNGYDNSGFNSSNDKLQSSMNAYDTAESDIFDGYKSNISDFELTDWSGLGGSTLAAIAFCSDYLQRLFDAMGLFNSPITLSLTLIFVLILVGYHRVRSHG